MAANNDFFVKFGSNATVWARELDRQLKPARDQVLAMEAMLNRLERKGDGVSTKLQRAFAKDLDSRGAGGGNAGSAPMPTGMSSNLEKAASQIYALTDSLEATVRALKGLPDLVKRTMREANGVVNQAVGANDQNRNIGSLAQRAGTYTTAGSPGAVNAQVYGILSKLGQNATPTISPVGISGVGSAAVIEGGLKRVQESIQDQTRQLIRALGNVKVETTPGAVTASGADTPARPGRTKAAATEVADAADTMVAGMRDQLEGARTVYGQMETLTNNRLSALRQEHGEESKIYQDHNRKLQANLQSQRATISQMEGSLARAEGGGSQLPEGATRAERTAERRALAEAAREEFKKLPLISEQELTRRQRELDLIRSTLDPNFLGSVGRGKGDYGKADLSEMGRALREQGFDPQVRSRDSMDTMALKVQEAGERFERTFQGTTPDSLRTTGFQKYRETEIPQNLQRILAQANDEVIQAYSREREESRRILSQTYSGGDTGDLSRGRRTYGTGLAKSEMGPVPLGQFTPSMVKAAEEAFKANSERQRESALGLMRQGNFDPYDPALTRGIKQGNTPEEKARAADALNVVRDLREASTEIDRTGQAYVSAGRKITAMERIIEYVRRQLLADANRPEGTQGLSRSQTKFLEDRLKVYGEGVGSQMQTRSQSRQGYGDLFDTPEYREGLDARRRSRQSYEANREAFRTGDRQNTFIDLRNGMGDALRQAMGSDFRFNETKGTIRNAQGTQSREDALELDKAFQHYISVLRQAADAARQGDPNRNNVLSRSENATVGLLNQLEKSFNGLAPRFEELASLGLDKTGYPLGAVGQDYDIRRIQDPANQAGEDRREAARQAAEAAKASIKKSDQGPEAAANVAREEATRKAKDLSRAEAEAAEATKELAAATRRRNASLKKLTTEERAAAERAVDDLRELSRQRGALENMFLQNGRDPRQELDSGGRYLMREPGVDSRVDTMGYPAAYGYNPDAENERKRLDREIDQARKTANTAYGGTNPDFDKKLSELGRLMSGSAARIQAIADARSEGDLKENSGYHAAREAEALAQSRINQLNAELAKASPVDVHEDLRENAARSKQIVASLQTQLAAAEEKAAKAAKKAADATGDGTEAVAAKEQTQKARKVAAAADDEAAALRTERAALRKEGPYTRGELKGLRATADDAEGAVSGRRLGALKGAITRAENQKDQAALKAAQDNLDARQKEAAAARKSADAAQKRYDRVREINRKLDALDGGSGAGGGGKPPVARGATPPTGPGDNNILQKILSAINAMHNTLKRGGIRVSGAVSGKTEPTGTSAAAPTITAKPRTTLTDEQRRARDESQNEQRRLTVEKRSLRNEETAESIERTRANRSNKASAAIREQEQAAIALSSAMGRLSESTRDEIRELERLNKADTKGLDKQALAARQREIAQSQTRVFGAVDADLFQQGILGTDRRAAGQAVLNQYGPQVSSNELGGIARAARAQNPSMMMDRELARGVPDADQSEWMQAWGGMFGNKGFWGRIVGSTGAFIVRNFAAGAVFGLTNGLTNVLDQALQTEMTFVRVSQALEATNKPLGNLRADLTSISTDYGVALNDVYSSAANLQGLFKDTESLALGTRVSTQLQVISGGALSATEAVGVLASTYTAFQNQADLQGTDGLQKIADTFTLIQNELGVNIETTAEGVSSLAGAADSLGLSFQEASVYAGQIAKLTNQTGAAAGEQLSRILGAAITGRGRSSLKDAFTGVIDEESGRDLGKAIDASLSKNDLGGVLENMMLGWNQLTKSQQSNLAVSLAGQRQMRAFQALMNDTEGTQALLTKAYRANGDAEARMTALMDTLNKRVDVLITNFQNLASALVQSGVFNFFGALLVLAGKTLDVINRFLGAMNKISEEVPFIGFLRDLVTFSAGAAISFKLLGSAVGGLRGALRDMRAEGGLSGPAGAVGSATGPTPGRIRPAWNTPPAIGPMTRAQWLEQNKQQVARPGFSSFGPSGPQTGITKTFAFGVDRAIRVPLERTGRILERGGTRWQQSSNRLTSSLGKFTSTISRGATGTAGWLSTTGQQGSYGSPGMRIMERGAGRLTNFADNTSSRTLGTVARGAGTALDKTSGALRGIASTGLAADAALIGLGLAISSIVSYRSQINELKRVAEDAASAYKAPAKPGETTAEDWMGPATEQMKASIKKWNDDGQSISDTFANSFGSVDNFFDSFGQLTAGATSRAIAEDKVGIGDVTKLTDRQSEFQDFLKDKKSPLADPVQGRYLSGMDRVGEFYASYSDAVTEAATGQAGEISGALERTSAYFQSDLQRLTTEVINDEKRTEAQKVAALALIESLDQAIFEMIADRKAVSMGLAGGLNSDQLSSLQTALGTIEATASGNGSVGGVDMSPIIDEQLNNVGLDAGTDLSMRLAKLRTSGNSTADSLVLQIKILQDSAKAAQANWLTALDKGTDSPEFQAADSQLSALLGELDRVAGGAAQRIVDEAEGLAVAAEQAGLYAKAARIRLAAMKDVNRVNRVKEEPNPVRGIRESSLDATPSGFGGGADPNENSKGKKQRATKDPALVAGFQAVVQNAIYLATKDITLQIARTSDAAVRAGLETLKAQVEAGILGAVASGAGISSIDSLPPRAMEALGEIPAPVVDLIDKGAKNYGSAAVSEQENFNAQVGLAEAQTGYADAQAAAADKAKEGSGDAAAKAAEARSNAAALAQARLGVAAAAADARGDAVAGAKIQVAMAQAQLQAAKIELKFAKTAGEIAQARIAILSAQAAVIGANAGVQSAQQDLIQSQYEVTIALAEAAGKTVLAAERQLGAARQALAAARKKSGGKATAEVNAARVSLIQAQAAARDAALQDKLDTIDFNLEIGKTTQSAAISALQEILRTSDLTRAQRRQLLLQIKGMKDEMADSQWNFGDIKLPTPYQMRRYITERRGQFASELEAAAVGAGGKGPKRRDLLFNQDGSQVGANSPANQQIVNMYINGADIGKVRQVIKEVVGGSGSINTRTTGARRNR